jgi:hypothetical protein
MKRNKFGVNMKNAKNQDIIEKAKKADWDDLANNIISLEISIRKEKNPKLLILLKNKLKLLEEEKSVRVFDSFNMGNFLNKNEEDVDL